VTAGRSAEGGGYILTQVIGRAAMAAAVVAPSGASDCPSAADSGRGNHKSLSHTRPFACT
jgi:hypothetical protein